MKQLSLKLTTLLCLVSWLNLWFLAPTAYATGPTFVSSGHTQAAATTVTLTGLDSGAGTNRGLIAIIVEAGAAGDSGTITSLKYNGVDLTLADTAQTSNGLKCYSYWMIGNSSGANNLVLVNNDASFTWVINAVTYSGVLQSGQPDSHHSTALNTTNPSETLNIVNAGAVAAVGWNNTVNGALTAGANTQARTGAEDGNGWGIYESNPTSIASAGNYTLNGTNSGSSQEMTSCAVALAPAASTPTVSIPYFGFITFGF